MTHTPGPWNYAGPSDIGRDSYSIYGSGPSNAVMVSMAYTAGPSDYGDAAEANARLIAAAPDLLAIVDYLAEAHRDGAQETHFGALFGDDDITTLGDAVTAAIDKATGQEEEL
jgi:hypothetical protein